ncbi:hypothetical protein L6452_26157 [Arctium lappa]|uniref:Uncharacterized protein n=1 Tax=Arctium lappa TaxID=4217 RepID=A0ACB9ABQ0_ARCLA|nr:hypothetical protein L6452_26157 [Arctium lappa]
MVNILHSNFVEHKLLKKLDGRKQAMGWSQLSLDCISILHQSTFRIIFPETSNAKNPTFLSPKITSLSEFYTEIIIYILPIQSTHEMNFFRPMFICCFSLYF